MLNTPVLPLVFNRADTATSVLNRIREVKPKQLFIAADGPRMEKAGEVEMCSHVRKQVEALIDWDCEVHKLYRDENLGCGQAVSSAIDWFFTNVDRGIILEDDTLPDITFFNYCETLLEYYKHDEEVMHVGGSNLQCGLKRGNYSYYFSAFPMIWGWATWKSAWKKYQYSIVDSRDTIKQNFINASLEANEVDFFVDSIEQVKAGRIDTWDYQWLYTLVKYGGKAIVPQYNLIQNLGFNEYATHTSHAPYWYKLLKNRPLTKISFAPKLDINSKADRFYMLLTLNKQNLYLRYQIIKHRVIEKMLRNKVSQYLFHE